jgi:S1-C subfamily serine protease
MNGGNDDWSEDPLEEPFRFDPLAGDSAKDKEINRTLPEEGDLLGGFVASAQNPKKAGRQKNSEKIWRVVLLVKVGAVFLVGAVLVVGIWPFLNQGETTDPIDWENYVPSVVLIYSPGCGHAGSGTLVLDSGFVLTNAHVVVGDDGRPCDLEIYAANESSEDPEWVASGEFIDSAFDEKIDLAVIRLVDETGRSVQLEDRDSIEIGEIEVALGSELKVIGYPGMGGMKITITPGEQAGWQTFDGEQWSGDFYKTSAKMGPGVSGGAAFDANTGDFIGIPTGGGGETEEGGDTIGLIRPSRYALYFLEQAESAG